ncbi:hypothetical protein NMG29_34150 [Streptomyces cocklensis]|nr:hypothetical protein [Actinacidiphila cocklensis]MDD1063173.1 hypothetical protein [Actinacidiphila cocklensis]
MSATHSWSGRLAVKSRSTRSGGRGGGRLRDCRAAPPAADHALQTQLGHQPLDGAAGHLVALAPERAGDPAGPIRAARILVDLLDQRHELFVAQPAGRLRPLLAGEVRRWRQLKNPADGIDPEASVAQVVDHVLGLVRGRSIS